MAGLRLDAIQKSYGEAIVLKALDLEIDDGEFLTLVGPSGCGKSTLLRIIAGLEDQSSGEVNIDDKPMGRVRPSERNLAMVFQSYALYPHLSVFDNIAVPLRMRDLSSWQRIPLLRLLMPSVRRRETDITARVNATAEVLGLENLLHRKPGELSGGQRQRVAVGRAIVRDPAAFLFDEPLSNLDAKLRVHMRAEITQLHRQLGTTFIYVTHDQAEAMTMSDRIAVMMNGEIVQIGSPDEVYNNPREVLVAEFIGSPKVNLFPGQISQHGSVLIFDKITNLRVNGAQAGLLQIGVRPENLQVCRRSEALFAGRVTLKENLGSEVFVHFTCADLPQSFVLRLPPGAACSVRLNDDIPLCFHPDHALIFDSHGKRLEPMPATAEVVNV